MTNAGIPKKAHQPFKIWELLVLAGILGLAAYLRLANVEQSPGWYTDEGTQLEIARNFQEGRVEYFALNRSTLLVARLPLFPGLLALAGNVFGTDMLTLRSMTAWLGVVTVFLVYFVVRWTQSGRNTALSLLTALMLAIYPNAVLYSRFGFSYNLLCPLILLVVLGLYNYLETGSQRWLALGVIVIGIGSLSDLFMFNLLLPLSVTVFIKRWRDLLWCLPLTLLPFTFYALWMLTQDSQAFFFDLQYTLFRLGKLSLIEQIATIALNFINLLQRDYWLGLALAGMFLLQPARLLRLTLLLFLTPFVTLSRTVALWDLSYYYMIPLFPFIALGVASLIHYGTPRAFKILQDASRDILQGMSWQPSQPFFRWLRVRVTVWITVLMLFFLIALPLTMTVAGGIFDARRGYLTPINSLLLAPQDTQAAASFINENLRPNEVVVISPGIGWLVEGNAADFQMSIAYKGVDTQHLPGDIPQDRFSFNPDYEQAQFVVIDNLWRNWAVLNMPEVAVMVEEVETWPLEFEAGEIKIYRNPRQA
jgi:hypothetical protein